MAEAQRHLSVGLSGVTKRYGEIVAVDDVDLEIERGDFFTLLGPSGSGKTTILRMIAGLVQPTGGRVLIEGEDVTGRPPYERNIAMVFQSLALFPHVDVFSNIAFPLRMRRVGRREVARLVREALEIVRLPHIESRKIDELSGGQRQRVALARALVYKPPLLLLDEPLGALDRRLREDMQLELVRLHREIDVTIVNVTHDQREALMLSNRIAVVHEGRVEQVDHAQSIYLAPKSPFVASFLGDATLVPGEVTDGTFAGGGMRIPANGTAPGPAVLVLRSEVMSIAGDQRALTGCDTYVQGQVEMAVFEGIGTYYEVRVPGIDGVIRVLSPRSRDARSFGVGERVWVGWHGDEAPVVAQPR